MDLGGGTLAENGGERKKDLKVKSAKRRKVREKESGYRERSEKGGGGGMVGVANGGSNGVGPGRQGAMDERRRKRIEQRKLRRQRSKVSSSQEEQGHRVHYENLCSVFAVYLMYTLNGMSDLDIHSIPSML